jgi:hypothetical protein
MIQIAAFLWDTNPLAHSLLEITRDYVVGKGITVSSKNPDVDRIIKRFWNDGSNQMDLKMGQRVLQLGLFGEQIYPAYVSDNLGLVRLGYIDPYLVERVLCDPDNPELLIGVITRSMQGLEGRRYKIILNPDQEAILSPGAIKERATFTAGEVFYFSVNRLSNATRGRSDLLTLLDWLDGYEQFLWEDLDRVTNHLMTFIWDVTFKGLTEEQITKKLVAMRAPRRGSLRGHNENVTWQAVAPDLKSAEVHNLAQTFKRHIIGTGMRFPLTWFGDPEDSNRASAGEMNDPPVVKLSARQLQILTMIKELLRYQLTQARLRGTLADDQVALMDPSGSQIGEPVDLHDAVEVTAPEISTKDTAKLATAMSQLSTSLMIATQEGWLRKETAARIYASVATQLGPEIDVSQEVQDELVTTDYADGKKIAPLRDATKVGAAPGAEPPAGPGATAQPPSQVAL